MNAWRITGLAVLAALVAAAPAHAQSFGAEAEAWEAVRRAYAPRAALEADDMARREQQAWEMARRRDEPDEYERYLREYRDGPHAREAWRRIAQLRDGDRTAFDRAVLRDSIEAYQYYLAVNPAGAYRDEAQRRIRQLRDLQRLRPPWAPNPTPRPQAAWPRQSALSPAPMAPPPRPRPLSEIQTAPRGPAAALGAADRTPAANPRSEPTPRPQPALAPRPAATPTTPRAPPAERAPNERAPRSSSRH